MKTKEIIRFLILRTIGNFLVLFTIFGFLATFGPALYFEATYRVATARGIQYQVAAEVPTPNNTPSQGNGTGGGLLEALLAADKEKILVPKSTYFSIVIPKIGASASIIANVDPSNEPEYLAALQKGVAHAKGSAFPGYGKNIYLFAHSTDNWWNVGRYNAVFYLLKELEKGDDISLFFVDRRYNYVVYDKKIVDPSDVSNLSAYSSQGENLVMQTCWPPGTTWKRLLVFAKPK